MLITKKKKREKEKRIIERGRERERKERKQRKERKKRKEKNILVSISLKSIWMSISTLPKHAIQTIQQFHNICFSISLWCQEKIVIRRKKGE
jgi:hypothetical protein